MGWRPRTVTIVGAGLCGSVLAMYLSQRGYAVDLVERRADVRTHPPEHQTSINLTLCPRGLAALDGVGVGDEVRARTTAARRRCVHLPEGEWRQPYGPNGEALLAIQRNELGALLLDELEQRFGVAPRFGVPCHDVQLDPLGLVVDNNRIESAEVVLAADGAFSDVRLRLQRQLGFHYHQEYSDVVYMQLDVPGGTGGWTDELDALHIWPRQDFLIAIPNRDGSFTATLQVTHVPDRTRPDHDVANDITSRIERLFPDAIAHLPTLADDVVSRPFIPMVTIACRPWSAASRVLLLGDAAHALYPSYGQGANAAFEDCAILNGLLDDLGDDWTNLFERFEAIRRPDADAIADLSRQHMRNLRTTIGGPEFRRRTELEHRVRALFPDRFRPLYETIAFTQTPYARAITQDQPWRAVLDDLCARTDADLDGDPDQLDKMILAAAADAGIDQGGLP